MVGVRALNPSIPSKWFTPFCFPQLWMEITLSNDVWALLWQLEMGVANNNKLFLLLKGEQTSVTRWLDYFQHMAIYINEDLLNGKQNLHNRSKILPRRK